VTSGPGCQVPFFGLGLMMLLLIASGALAAAPTAIEEGGEKPTGSAQICLQPSAQSRCLEGCRPAKQIFLPCMAVGASNMAACRKREIDRCTDRCRLRYC
jgi:hypothetical protein